MINPKKFAVYGTETVVLRKAHAGTGVCTSAGTQGASVCIVESTTSALKLLTTLNPKAVAKYLINYRDKSLAPRIIDILH